MKYAVICCVLCACANATPKMSPVIENSIPAPRVPTLEGNTAATVSVFYTFINPDTGEMVHFQNLGVVLDAKHVLAVISDGSDMASFIGWRKARFIFATVMSYTPDVTEHLIKGPASPGGWLARVVAETAYVGILEVSRPMPIYPVVFAIKKPRAGEDAYALGHKVYDLAGQSSDDETFIRVWFSTVVEPQLVYYWQYMFAQDFAFEKFKDKYPTECGVFNEQDEFVGFFTTDSIEIASSSRWSNRGFRVLSLKSLTPLLHEAGIAYTSAD